MPIEIRNTFLFGLGIFLETHFNTVYLCTSWNLFSMERIYTKLNLLKGSHCFIVYNDNNNKKDWKQPKCQLAGDQLPGDQLSNQSAA